MEGKTRQNPALISTGCQCAQRLSASLKETPWAGLRKAGGFLCSTPFGIIEGNTIEPPSAVWNNGWCSTPFGIMEGNTRHGSRPCSDSGLCSTPFGIMEGNTTANLARGLAGARAQRLSASLKETRCGGPAVPAALMCSTPFGIIEGNTGRPDASPTAIIKCSTPFGIMEGNTIRLAGPCHRACSTPFGIMEGNTQRGRCRAQRLSASFGSIRAQRLSASWKETHFAERSRPGCHACSTPFGIIEGNTCIAVASSVNSSFGAQRLSASLKETHDRQCGWRIVARSVRAQRLSASLKETR